MYVMLYYVTLSFMIVINKHISVTINLSADRCTVQFTGCLTLACCWLYELCTFISLCFQGSRPHMNQFCSKAAVQSGAVVLRANVTADRDSCV
jgi:hypothetical protein